MTKPTSSPNAPRKASRRVSGSLTFDPAEHFQWSLDDLLAKDPIRKGQTSQAESQPVQDKSSNAPTDTTDQPQSD